MFQQMTKLLPMTGFVHIADEDDEWFPPPVVSPHFCSPDADLILSSSDSVQFRVFRVILCEASHVFRAALSSFQQSEGGEPPVVDVPESSEVIEAILRYVFPIPNPVISSFAQLRELLVAAQKYAIVGALEDIRATLVSPSFVEADPLLVYCIACKFGLSVEAKIASRYTLNLDIMEVPESEELEQLSALAFLRLVRLHQTRSRAAMELLGAMNPFSHGCGKAPRWWAIWTECAEEELKHRPTAARIFEPAFIMPCVKKSGSQCKECPSSFLSSGVQEWLGVLKDRIDALKDTI